ncbi:basic helix-loop-helix ARNT-like protein cyc isoform X1 [Tachypleus tridentatus]|uniref:basic helix-loop-helix ARNT-like protein cyc isoform X1 n=2 Tax=Tachypleus tridentatus TaxID=6853 RepID=UPI003FD3382C
MDVGMGLDVNMETLRKRKINNSNDASDMEDEDVKVQKLESEQTKRHNHSEIEKRRRDKMNTYITELSSMVPMCNAMSRKLDKLTVLRMAVQHMKTLRGSINSYTEGHYKPSFLSDEELKYLILEAAEGFLFVVSCDRGRILFVSESVSQILNYSQGDLLGQSWFDILHPKDIAKVKEQLSSSDLSPKERLIDAKTMLPVKTDMPSGQSRLCPGSRRSFFCRMKCRSVPTVKEEADTTTGCHRKRKCQSSDRKYLVIHCTGYLKSWAPAKLNLQEETDSDGESCNLSCLVAVGRVHPEILQPEVPQPGLEVRPLEFVSRHAMDGKFLYVDQRATLMLGYLPQELLGTSFYEYCHQDDISQLADSHKQVLQTNERLTTRYYRFRTKEGSFICMQSKWKNFKNPWTKEFEYLIAVNFLIPYLSHDPSSAPDVAVVESSNATFEEMLNNSNSLDAVLSAFPSTSSASTSDTIQKFLNTRVGASKIGRQIADEAMEVQRLRDSSASNSPVPVFDNNVGLPDRTSLSVNSSIEDQTNIIPGPSMATMTPVEPQHLPIMNGDIRSVSPSQQSCQSNQSQYSGTPHNSSVSDPDIDIMDTLMGRDMLSVSYQNNSNEGNDEAAMAVIMSLLEADAGLGGPVDFSGLPWPLP